MIPVAGQYHDKPSIVARVRTRPALESYHPLVLDTVFNNKQQTSLQLKMASSTILDPLTIAIDTISDERLREIFQSICWAVPEARQLAAEELLVDITEKREVGDSDSEESDSSVSEDEDSESEDLTPILNNQPQPQPNPGPINPAASRPKRPVPRYAFCSNCKDEFDVTTNSSKSCAFHPEDAEPTGDDLWVDNEFGVEDTPRLREERPDCFEFMCCGETLEENPDGCEVGWHVEGGREAVVKRVRTFDYQPSGY
ncbi:hypothetical protein BJX76DRAFT_355591 [Aspergillus varians]